MLVIVPYQIVKDRGVVLCGYDSSSCLPTGFCSNALQTENLNYWHLPHRRLGGKRVTIWLLMFTTVQADMVVRTGRKRSDVPLLRYASLNHHIYKHSHFRQHVVTAGSTEPHFPRKRMRKSSSPLCWIFIISIFNCTRARTWSDIIFSLSNSHINLTLLLIETFLTQKKIVTVYKAHKTSKIYIQDDSLLDNLIVDVTYEKIQCSGEQPN